LAHLRITASRDDAVSWMRALRLVKNVGHAKSRAILHWMREQGAAPEQLGAWPKITARDKGLSSLAALMAQLKPLGEHPKAACDAVMAYYLPILKEKFDDHPKRRKDLEQLCTMAERYGRVKGFIDDLILDPPASSRDMASAGSTPALTLSTVHSAKGLEWPVVILIWVSEGRFPPLRAYRNPAELEEERRLLYVAATRAKDELIFCHPGEEAQVRFPAGPVAGGRAGLSSFLQALPPSLVAGGRSERLAPGGRWGGASLPEAGDLAPPPENSEAGDGAPFRQGDRVRHPAFGPGVISKRPDSDKVEVIFRNGGRKLLHLAYTTLERC
jgi:DNA helicase-2/ATP-dependent DNA helicase PcrA